MARYSVRTDRIPHEWRRQGFVAWIGDDRNRSGPNYAVSWHQRLNDAEGVCSALNSDEALRQALRAAVKSAA